MHFRGDCLFCVCVCLLVGIGMEAGDSMMEEDQAGTSLINVSDGLWHRAAVRRLSVGCLTSQAAQ